MGVACGIVGLPNVGKSTIFNAITLSESGERSNYMFSTTEPVRGTVDVPDQRLPKIAEVIPPEKVIPAQMIVVDIPGLVSGSSKGEGMGVSFLGAIKESDVLLHVVRCFEAKEIQHVSGSLDPATDAEIVELELMHVDLQTVDRNIKRVKKKARVGDQEAVAANQAFDKAKQHLEADEPLRIVDFSDQERELLKPLFLLTIKPVLFVANVGDDDLDGASEMVAGLRAYAEKTRSSVLHLCGDIEAELVRMSEEEREGFKQDLGLEDSGLTRLIHAGFELLGLQTYFTVGEDEVRAWVIHRGDTAPVGAGVIHTDFLQKFIRAQVYSFDNLMEYRSEAAIKAAGKMRVEGKTYVLQDGDVCHFLIGH